MRWRACFLVAVSLGFQAGIVAQEKAQTEEDRIKAMEQRVLVLDKEIAELSSKLFCLFETPPPLLKGCGLEYKLMGERVATAVAKLQSLEAKNAEPSQLNAVKKELAGYAKEIEEVLEVVRKHEEYSRKTMPLRQKLGSLQIERDVLVLELKSTWR